MTPIEKIKFSFPCGEDINKMTTCSLGRHCASCDKTVIDFRNRSHAELTKALEEHGTICGIFSKYQTQQTPKTNLFKQLVTGILVTLGFGSFSEDLFAQIKTCDSLSQTQIVEEESEVLVGAVVETMPTFKNGGDKGLFEFLKKNLKYPDDNLEGRVIVGFTIDTLGKPTNIKILRSLSQSADKEVLRVVELLEFNPGTQHGKKIAVSYSLPVTFGSENDKKKKK